MVVATGPSQSPKRVFHHAHDRSCATDTGSTDSGSGDTSGTTDPAVQAAVEQCKAAIDSNPAVKDDIKPDLQQICEKAASGDAQAAKDAAKEVCLKIVESSGLPDSALATAKSACDKAGQ